MKAGFLLLLLGSLLCFGQSPATKAAQEKASVLLKVRKPQEAKAVLEQALQAEPRQVELLTLLGEAHLRLGDAEKALECADKAIQLDPNKARAYTLRGNTLGRKAMQVNFLRAMTLVGGIRGAYEKGVHLDPGSRETRSGLFNFYLNAPSIAGGGLDKAEAFAEQTMAHDRALGHRFKGLIRDLQKNPRAAQAEYRLSLQSDPKAADTYNMLGYAELELKEVDQALEHFLQQVRLDPENPNSYDSLGDGWLAKGRLDEAIAAYRKSLALDPLFTASMRSLGKALEQAGRRDEAIQHYRHCAQLGTQKGITQIVKEANARLQALGAKD